MAKCLADVFVFGRRVIQLTSKRSGNLVQIVLPAKMFIVYIMYRYSHCDCIDMVYRNFAMCDSCE